MNQFFAAFSEEVIKVYSAAPLGLRPRGYAPTVFKAPLGADG